MQFEVCYSMDGKVCLYRYGSCQSAKIRLKNLIELLYFLKASSSLSTLSYVQELNKARMTRRMIERRALIYLNSMSRIDKSIINGNDSQRKEFASHK